jgi:hypothetical protein
MINMYNCSLCAWRFREHDNHFLTFFCSPETTFSFILRRTIEPAILQKRFPNQSERKKKKKKKGTKLQESRKNSVRARQREGAAGRVTQKSRKNSVGAKEREGAAERADGACRLAFASSETEFFQERSGKLRRSTVMTQRRRTQLDFLSKSLFFRNPPDYIQEINVLFYGVVNWDILRTMTEISEHWLKIRCIDELYWGMVRNANVFYYSVQLSQTDDGTLSDANFLIHTRLRFEFYRHFHSASADV